MRLYSILDRKAGTYGAVMMAPNDGMMVRSLKEHTAPNHTLYRFCEDFDLYEVGSFDENGGVIESSIRFVCNLQMAFPKEG